MLQKYKLYTKQPNNNGTKCSLHFYRQVACSSGYTSGDDEIVMQSQVARSEIIVDGSATGHASQ